MDDLILITKWQGRDGTTFTDIEHVTSFEDAKLRAETYEVRSRTQGCKLLLVCVLPGMVL